MRWTLCVLILSLALFLVQWILIISWEMEEHEEESAEFLPQSAHMVRPRSSQTPWGSTG